MDRSSRLLILCGLLLYYVCWTEARSSGSLYYVPSKARAGHIITILPTQYRQLSRVTAPSDPGHASLFSVTNQGALITTQDISQLAGKYVTLNLQHQRQSDKWTEVIQIKVHTTSSNIEFEHQPYDGYISENQPPGTQVGGLETLAEDSQRFPYGCQFTLTESVPNHRFQLFYNKSQIYIAAQQSLDYEIKKTIFFTVEAVCPNSDVVYSSLRIHVLDENDNTPQLVRDFYFTTLPITSAPGTKVLSVSATDDDEADTIRYSLDGSEAFQIDPVLGSITVSRSQQLEPKSYQLEVRATDRAGHNSQPGQVIVEVVSQSESPTLKRERRAIRDERVFVVNKNLAAGSDLFSVASVPPDPTERFSFLEPRSDSLLMDYDTGMVSRGSGHVWNDTLAEENFYVNVSKINDPNYEDSLPVRMPLVERGPFDAILTNEPQPLWVTIPVWIRPETTIFTAQSVDAELYGAAVVYTLETGDSSLFRMVPETGEVKIVARQEWPDNEVYQLAISAECVGAALQPGTPSQVLHIQVGYRDPQFYIQPQYIVGIPETSGQGSSVATIQAKSFQELPLRYNIVADDSASDGMFTIDPDTGRLSLLRSVEYIKDHAQYRYQLTVSEITPSPHSSTTTLVLNLVPENRHNPYFAPSVYIRRGLPENSPLGTTVIRVTGIDLDPFELGMMEFEVSDDHFEVRPVGSDGKEADIVIAKTLDYDYQPEHMYSFQVTAVDGGGRSGFVNVHVFVDNVNDHRPVFLPDEQRVRVKEGVSSSIGSVHVVQAYDPDGDGISFRFNRVDNANVCTGTNTDNQCDIFNLNPVTGHITLNQQVDRGRTDLDLTVEAVDDGSCCGGGGGGASKGLVKIQFIGVNHPPNFPECGTFSASVLEGSPSNTSVIEITATDSDSGLNGQVDFSVVYKSFDERLFNVRSVRRIGNQHIAELYTLEEFNREEPRRGAIIIEGEVKYRVTVKAEDNGYPKLSTNCFLFVTIGDMNDNAPQFDDTYINYMLRTHPQGDRVVRVFAIDDDEGENARVTYSVQNPSNCANCFLIDQDSGWISKGNGGIPSDTTELILNVTARDNGTPFQQSSTTSVTINIVDTTSSLPPKWQRYNGAEIDDTSVMLQENVEQNTRVGTSFQATYQSGSSTIYYYLGRGRTPQENLNYQFRRNIANEAMELYTNSPLDFGLVPEYTLKLRASTGAGTPYSDARLTVRIEDVNNNIPEFVGVDTNGIYPAAVSSETIIGESVITVAAIDLDGTSPNNRVTYSFDANCAANDCAAFRIDSNSGRITADQTFDRNLKASYLLSVVATDGAPSAVPGVDGPNTETAKVSVLVIGATMRPPFFEAPTHLFSINEGVPFDTEVTTLIAQNPDPEYNFPQYSIIAGNEAHRYAVNSDTGRIYATGGIRSSQSPYTLTYRVFDGFNINSTLVTVTINKQNLYDPVFSPLSYDSSDIVELDNSISPSNPRTIATVVASDPDGSSPMTYYIEGQLVSDNLNTFVIDSSTGVVRLQQPLARDYPEGFDNWMLTVRATDSPSGLNPRSGYGVINLRLIDLNNNAPKFDTNQLVGNVDEESASGVSVLQLVATDVDEGDNGRVTYEVPSPSDIPQIGGQDLFSVSSAGLITTTSAAFQILRLNQDRYTFTVRARDNAPVNERQSTDQKIEVVVQDINNHFPRFVGTNQYSISMPEMIPVGGSVATLTAMDEDLLENARRIFTVTGFPPDSEHYQMDSIFPGGTGVIRIKQLVDFDEMTDPTMSFNVRVENPSGGSPDSATVIVTVTDVNDNAPVISPASAETTITEPGTLGGNVASFTATDRDSGENAQFTFAIDYKNTDPEKKFQVNPTSGQVTLRNLLDREVTSGYQVHVLAIDKGVPPMTGTATLSVTVGDINDNAPDFTRPLPRPIVQANAARNSEVFRFTVTDPDTEANGPPFTLEYVCNSPPCQDFTFRSENDGRTGIVIAARDGYNTGELGFKFYNLQIRMTDNPTSGQSAMSAVREIRLDIQGGNYAPQDSGTKDVTVYNYKRQFDNILIGTVYCKDEDDFESDREDKTFTFIQDYEHFILDRDAGTIVMRKSAGKGDHDLEIEVYDKKWDKTTISTVHVYVSYIEDDTVETSASFRLTDTTAEELMDRSYDENGNARPNKLEDFQRQMASDLDTKNEFVQVFGVRPVPGVERQVDISFSAHGSPYYPPSKLNGIITGNQDKYEQVVGAPVSMVPVDLCRDGHATCWDSGCTTRRVLSNEPILLNTNSASLVSVNITYEYDCQCAARTFSEGSVGCYKGACLNNGTCQQNWAGDFNCDCPDGFDGERCQQTKVTFSGKGWAHFEPLQQCEDSKFSFEFATLMENALLLYDGPVKDTSDQDVRDFISVELIVGYPRLRANLGDGEVTISVDGRDATGAQTLEKLSDGSWHTITVWKRSKEFRLVVDHCRVSTVTETIESSVADRRACEVIGESTGESFLLNLYSPLQLGGRSVDTSYPPGLQGDYEGCIKNLWVNGQMYDLSTEYGANLNVEDGCTMENCTGCPTESTCIGNIRNRNVQCTCKPGYRGVNCDIEVTTKTFEAAPSYIEWELRSNFNDTISPNNYKDNTFQIMFRTRQENGMIFSASSFSTLEQFKLEVVDKRLMFYYDLGSGNRYLSLYYVEVNDGLWHTVKISRFSNQAVLQMDLGEGKFYNETWIEDQHRLIYLTSMLFGAADISYQPYTDNIIATRDLTESCLRDPRYGDAWFPMDSSEQGEQPTSAATVRSSRNTQNNCPSNINCATINCPTSQECFDMWRYYECRCQDPMFIRNPADITLCIEVTDCSIDPCINGDCLSIDDSVICDCDTGWEGRICNETIGGPSTGGVTAAVATHTIIIIVLAIILLLVLVAIIVGLMFRRRKPDYLLGVEPDEDIRENMGYYEEEGAGEEDMHAFDLSRLQKPVDPRDLGPMTPDGTMQKPPPEQPIRRWDDPQQTAAPDTMGPRRPFFPPGDYPDIGDFIDAGLNDADDDPNAPPYDSVREYEYEGGGSLAGSLSSLQSSSSGDQDFDYLNDFGPRFQKLADLYGGGDDEEDTSSV